ncbi:kinase-like protein [Gloeophyllum trabeum ATCC 11539]|uniref:Kinase-like protein n=1 Tax=Gloeophyllum trabeum (strain ATCC 11539 / FP-39264 / Madison 617) TaxID=670483 RepID=S7Q043_GLOTA|nr:kinase-like protein [Gloeophyllum trabeum ATCC 11539]EPQ53058.1 kinase-like protein [Gloeophyllum trabeum ATCC 11539]
MLILYQALYREGFYWKQLHHPNMYPFLGLSIEPFSDGRPCLVSPWSNFGEVDKFLSRYPEHDRLKIVEDVAEGLYYLHNRDPPFVHGDLKTGSIMIDIESVRPCITDFGIGKHFQSFTATLQTSRPKGTAQWMAPEVLYNQEQDYSKVRNPSSDMYSFACVCLEIYTGRAPWYHERVETTVILNVIGGKRPPHPDGVPDKIWTIITSCWRQEPGSRMRIAEVREALRSCRAEPVREMLANAPVAGNDKGTSKHAN